MSQHLLKVEELIAILGEKKTFQLCKLFAGKKIPSAVRFLQIRRDQTMIAEWLKGEQVGSLSAKYLMTKAVIQRKITQYLKDHVPKEDQEKILAERKLLIKKLD